MKLSHIAFLQPTVDIEVAAQPIRVATLPETFLPAQPRSSPSGPTQPFGDARQHGRLDASLGDPRAVFWILRYSTPLRPDSEPHSVLQSGDSIVVQAAFWQIFDADGGARGAGLAGSGPVTISESDRTLRWVDGEGSLAAASLDDGALLWTHGLFFGDSGVYPFLALQGSDMVVVGTELVVDPEAEARPSPTLAVEIVTLTEPLDVAEGAILLSVTSPGALTAPSDGGDVFAVASEDTVVVAWRDHVMFVRLDLSVKRLVAGTFEPRALSLGDAGRVYLIVRTEEGPQLWMLNGAGEQVYSSLLPEEADDTLAPPMIAPDHRVFVVTSKRIVAFSPTGEWLWEFAPGGRPYASITADGWLLVAVDHSLGVIDLEGRGTSIFNAPGEVFCTAPVLTPAGEILLASEHSLFCLQYVEVGSITVVQ